MAIAPVPGGGNPQGARPTTTDHATPTPAASTSGRYPGNVADNHKALLSVLLLVAFAFVAAGIADHSPQSKSTVVALMAGATFLLTLNLGLWSGNSGLAAELEQYPWLPTRES